MEWWAEFDVVGSGSRSTMWMTTVAVRSSQFRPATRAVLRGSLGGAARKATRSFALEGAAPDGGM